MRKRQRHNANSSQGPQFQPHISSLNRRGEVPLSVVLPFLADNGACCGEGAISSSKSPTMTWIPRVSPEWSLFRAVCVVASRPANAQPLAGSSLALAVLVPTSTQLGETSDVVRGIDEEAVWVCDSDVVAADAAVPTPMEFTSG